MTIDKNKAPRQYARLWRIVVRRYRVCLERPGFVVSAIGSIVALCASLGITAFAIRYSTESASNSVTDVILSNTPVFNVGYPFVYGLFFFIVCVAYICLTNPKRMPFMLYSLALFVGIRAVFVSMTHIGPFVPHLESNFGPTITALFFGGDQFFSGHAGAPFLLALMYWHEKKIRYIFLSWSVFFSVVVLLGHLHYTIDVASAFFMAFGIYHIALYLLPEEKRLFEAAVPV